jgi:hypothetical protein
MIPGADKRSPPARVLAPRLLLLGVVTGFMGCCLAGHILARVNCLRNFSRFHLYIDYQTLYYPTVAQVRSLAREKLPPNKIAVVLGGNSLLQGFGQGAAGNWAVRLQELLGDDFQVLNLALPNLYPFEFGAVAAEVLLHDHPRLILLTNHAWPAPQAPAGEPDGRPFVRYFYWQARARGLLADNPERDIRLYLAEGGRDESFRELRRQCSLDARLGFHDLWNAASYHCLSTVWCPLLAASWTRPRGAYDDPDPVLPPVDQCRPPAFGPLVLANLRDAGAKARLFFPPPGKEGDWREPDSPLPESVRECLPPELRRRTLVLLNHHCPHYLSQLTAEEKEVYSRSFAVMVRLFARVGVRAFEVSKDLPAEYFTDSLHLTAAGGQRLAEEVAPKVRELAEQLGYRSPEPGKLADLGARPAPPQGK